MAAEMPVKDVLCEAMEYLSRLGSNLRTRSENLKEKKIRKDKLTNALAVQKAADKVLLICELSKKSLVNVETGMRKILEHIDVTQASSSVGGKSSSSKTNAKDKRKEDKTKYHYFDYKSRKLKIKNKISIKHYKSVKVLAKKMTTAMVAHYPVYYDCKLYRMRRKKDLKKQENSKKILEKPETGNKESITVPSDGDSSNEPLNNLETDTSKTNITTGNRKSIEESLDSDSDEIKSPLKKKPCHKIIDSDDQDDSHKENQNLDIDENESNGSTHKNDTKKTTISSCDNENENSSSNNDKSNFEKNDSENAKKPVIKCVSLSKLLKPDVIKNNPTKPPSLKNNKIGPKKLIFDVAKKNEMLQTAKKKKEESLAKKRKEVNAFKPKKFVINITRLPNLDTEFLMKNNIKKIIKEGNTICEFIDSIVQQQTKSSIAERPEKSTHCLELMALSDDPDSELVDQANKIKNMLLFESDSDNEFGEKQAESTVDSIKNSLLNSDSDQNEDASVNICIKQWTESTGKNEVKNNQGRVSNTQSDTDNNEDCQKTKENHGSDESKTVYDSEAAKNYLLDKTDSDNKSDKSEKDLPASPIGNKTPEMNLHISDDVSKNSTHDFSDDILDQKRNTTTQSKKKHIREIAEAKHALLRYSSSENEDDQLKIKRSLLEGSTDDENNLKATNVDDQGRTSQQSSSSTEDMLLKIKKNKKSKETDSHSSRKKRTKRKRHLIQSDNEEENNRSSNDDFKSSSKKVRSAKKKT